MLSFFAQPALKTDIMWPAVLMSLTFWLAVAVLPACAMSAVMASEGSCLAEFPQQGSGNQYSQYNDPWDYLGFVMANSRPSTNSDGYGVVGYTGDSYQLEEQHKWFKRVVRPADFDAVYYTGSFVRQGLLDYSYPLDVLDLAMFQMKNPSQDIAIALCHARNATGVTLGNHPFWFNYNGRTYTLMHNGNANRQGFHDNRITQMNSELDCSMCIARIISQMRPQFWWILRCCYIHYDHIIARQNDTRRGIITPCKTALLLDTVGWGVYNYIFLRRQTLCLQKYANHCGLFPLSAILQGFAWFLWHPNLGSRPGIYPTKGKGTGGVFPQRTSPAHQRRYRAVFSGTGFQPRTVNQRPDSKPQSPAPRLCPERDTDRRPTQKSQNQCGNLQFTWPVA